MLPVKQHNLKQARAQRRAHASSVGSGSQVLTHAEQRSVSPAVQRQYLKAFNRFELWAEMLGIQDFKRVEKLDERLVQYLDSQLYRTGEGISIARTTLYGVIFNMGLPRAQSVLPRSRRALKGFAKDEPPVVKDPAPLEALALMAEWLVVQPLLTQKLAAAALLISFDLFARPSEVLELTGDEVLKIDESDYQGVSVVFGPSINLDEHGNEIRCRKPSKNGEFDDTVMAGLDGLGLEWIPELLMLLRQQCRRKADPLLFPLDLATFEKHVKEASAQLGLQKLKLTPHGARHGGPSRAMMLGLLDLKQVAKRGRWSTLTSVRRYEKSGKLVRVVARIPPSKVRAATRSIKAKHTSSGKAGLANVVMQQLAQVSALRKRRA